MECNTCKTPGSDGLPAEFVEWHRLPFSKVIIWQRVFPLWTLTGENERVRGLSGWITAFDWELARSDSLAARGRGTCHGFHSTVGTATTEIRTLRELGLHTFIPLKQDYFTDNGNVLLVKAITWYRHPYLEPQIVDLIKCSSQDVMVTSNCSEKFHALALTASWRGSIVAICFMTTQVNKIFCSNPMAKQKNNLGHNCPISANQNASLKQRYHNIRFFL